MFLQNGIRSTKVAIAIEGKQVLTQMIKLPLMPNEEMKEVVKGEASHYAVFAGKRVIVGLQSLEKIIEAGVQRVNVLWAAVEYEAVNILKKMLEEILIVSSFSKARHLKLVAVDILPLAILRCLKPKQAELPENAGTIVVCIGERTTYVTITKGKSVMIGRNGGTICSIQNIDIGSNSIIEITGANDITSVKNVPQRLTELINEIQKSFGYSKSLKLDWDGKIILSADISALINFDKFLSKQLGVEVEVYNPLNFITYNKEDFSAEYLNRMSTSLTSVIGLAMSNCKEKNSVNLLPEKQLKDLLKSHILPIFWE